MKIGDSESFFFSGRNTFLRSSVKLLGSSSNDNGDGNENVISKYKFALDPFNVFNMTRVW